MSSLRILTRSLPIRRNISIQLYKHASYTSIRLYNTSINKKFSFASPKIEEEWEDEEEEERGKPKFKGYTALFFGTLLIIAPMTWLYFWYRYVSSKLTKNLQIL